MAATATVPIICGSRTLSTRWSRLGHRRRVIRYVLFGALVSGAGCDQKAPNTAGRVPLSKVMSGASPTIPAAAGGSSASGTCKPAGAPELKAFAVYAEKSVLLDPGVVVNGGNVGVKDSSGPYLHEDFALSLMPDAKVQPGAVYGCRQEARWFRLGRR